MKHAATEESANQVMTLLRADITGWGVDEESLQIPVPALDGGGLRSTHLVSSFTPPP
jgi:E3 ubiquitin-protein ligase SHPRH